MTPEQRFWTKVDTSNGPDACWPWIASTFRERRGYGKFQAGTSRETARIVYAHRYAWELANRSEIPPGMFACHRCDNPVCCNPRHIFIGTPADNMRDMSDKGRSYYQLREACKHGHPWTPENTTYYVSKRSGKNIRRCRACRHEEYLRGLPLLNPTG